MAEGRNRTAWGHTSSLMALIVNVNRMPDKAPASPSRFDPYRRRRRRRASGEQYGIVDQLTNAIMKVSESRQEKG